MSLQVNKIGNIEALGTKWNFEFFEEIEDSRLLRKRILEYLRAFENKYSRFKDSSLISKLNRDGALQIPDEETLHLFTKSLNLYNQTGGVFNILIGGTLESFGYDSEYSFEINPIRKKPEKLSDVLTVSEETIRLRQGYHIDLGGFGKGFLIDSISKMLHEEFGLNYYLVNGGGDILVTSNNNQPVKIVLENPDDDEEYLFEIELLNQSFAASSSAKRKWKDPKSEIVKTHLIDPTNVNRLIEGATFVVADSAVDADAYATALAISPELRKKLPSKIHYLIRVEDKWMRSGGFPDLK